MERYFELLTVKTIIILYCVHFWTLRTLLGRLVWNKESSTTLCSLLQCRGIVSMVSLWDELIEDGIPLVSHCVTGTQFNIKSKREKYYPGLLLDIGGGQKNPMSMLSIWYHPQYLGEWLEWCRGTLRTRSKLTKWKVIGLWLWTKRIGLLLEQLCYVDVDQNAGKRGAGHLPVRNLFN